MHIIMIQVSGYEWHEDIGIKMKIILDHIYMCVYIYHMLCFYCTFKCNSIGYRLQRESI